MARWAGSGGLATQAARGPRKGLLPPEGHESVEGAAARGAPFGMQARRGDRQAGRDGAGDQSEKQRGLALRSLGLSGSTLSQEVIVRGSRDVVVPSGRGPRNGVIHRSQQEQQQAEEGRPHG